MRRKPGKPEPVPPPPPEEQREAVLEYMDKTGVGATDAAKHFWPGISPAQLKKKSGQIRVWKNRHGLPSERTQPAKRGSGATGVPVPPPNTAVAKMKTSDRLRWQLERMAASAEQAYLRGDTKGHSAAAKMMLEIGEKYDIALEREGKVDELDRTAEGLAKKVNILGELHDRMRRHGQMQAKKTL